MFHFQKMTIKKIKHWIGCMFEYIGKVNRYKAFRSKPAYHRNRNFDRMFFFSCCFCTSAETTFNTFVLEKPVARKRCNKTVFY